MHRIPTRLMSRRPAARPPFFYPPLLSERSNVLFSGHRLIRTVDGAILVTDFTNTSLWVMGSGFTQDLTRPYHTARVAPSPLLTHGLTGTSDGGGCREPRLTVAGDGSMILSYDAGDGTYVKPGTNWQQQSATWTNWGAVGPTKNGIQAGLNHGGFASYCTAGSRKKVGPTTWYNYVLNSATEAHGIPSQPYPSQIYTSTISGFGPWTYVRDCPVDVSGPGTTDAYISMSYFDGTQWVFFKGVTASGVYNCERYTASAPDALPIPDGNGGCFTSTVLTPGGSQTANPENPTVFHWAAVTKWLVLTNDVGQATDTFYVDDPANCQSGTTYRVRQQIQVNDGTSYDGVNCIGMCTPLTDEYFNVLFEPDGAFGVVWDTHGDSGLLDGIPANNVHRDIWQGHFLPMPAALRFQSPTPGVNNPQYAVYNLGFNLGDHIAELDYWNTRQLAGSANDWAFCFDCSNSNTSPDFSGDGYAVYIGTGQCQYFYWQGGAFQGFIGTATPTVNIISYDRFNIDARNRIKWSRTGTTLGLSLDYTNITPFTDSHLSTNPYLKVRGNSYDSSLSFLRIYKSATTTVTGATPGATVRLLGASGVVFATAVADGGGTALLTSHTYPMYQIQIGTARPMRPPPRANGDARIFGGDTYNFK